MGENRVGPRYLFFENWGQRFALDIGHVREIIFPRMVTPVPLAPGFLSGLINLRGRITTVFSLGKIMSLEGEEGTFSAMIVLHVEEAALAFGVEKIIGIESLSQGILGEVTTSEKLALPQIRAVFQYEGYPVGLLDIERTYSFLFEHDYQGNAPVS